MDNSIGKILVATATRRFKNMIIKEMKKTKIFFRVFCTGGVLEIESEEFLTLQQAEKMVQNEFVTTARVSVIEHLHEGKDPVVIINSARNAPLQTDKGPKTENAKRYLKKNEND